MNWVRQTFPPALFRLPIKTNKQKHFVIFLSTHLRQLFFHGSHEVYSIIRNLYPFCFIMTIDVKNGL